MDISKKKSPKRILTYTIALLFTFPLAFGQTHFSGFTGVAGNIGTSTESGGVQFTADAFFSGQVDLFGVVLLRAGATVHTNNLLSIDVFNAVPARFTLDEFSITARFPCCHVTRYLSLFAGKYESIGSDLFLRRHFGILPIDSRLTETWVGITDATIYPFSNLGASYVLKLKTPQAFGLYFYVGDREGQPRGNVDLRFAGVFPILTVDFSAGVGFPITMQAADGGTALSLNRRIEFHTGFSTVIGNTHTASLFLQFGITKVLLNPEANEQALKLSDLYFLVEPRFRADFMHFHFSLFNMPQSAVQNLFFVTNTLGANLAIFAENIYAGAFNFTVGAHLTVSAQADLKNVSSITSKDISFRVSPFIETPLFSGVLMSRFTIDFMKFAEMHKTIRFTLGYRTEI